MGASEHKISEQWDVAIETGIKRMAYGLAGGAVAALVLFRGGASRATTIGFGAGVGFGSTYADTKRAFEHLSGTSASVAAAAPAAADPAVAPTTVAADKVVVVKE
eukprot:TRINITY_DN5506_c0_g1_i1.p4 TRINITY_DN5506_c0_g1~~TRINITY_DN5506_c0_g1_i1.p4  ORF type:complete len:105 (+),score=51.19 TRINITY_DN5506_c0_g1_i1:96-410(+)